ncbi:MAG TPA: ribbon-helix-helix protein, CopG family [Thermoanaerobaculia bacterium]|nr:ribbon-helix-helix protein, CopG family [Thermoanaerobaculia bacterium]
MAKPTTIRLPDELLAELDRRAQSHQKDRAVFLRELLRDALARDLEEEVVAAYREGRLSLSEAARRLELDPWSWFDLLRRRKETLSVELEDWIDSRSAL